MNKKIKKKPKKKDKQQTLTDQDRYPETRALKDKIKRLEKELSKQEGLIKKLRDKLQKITSKKGKKNKSDKAVPNPLFSGQTSRVGVAQREAWRRHGYLRDRYEFHLNTCQDKGSARLLADKDLRDKYGEDAGYTEQELEQILS